MPTPSFTVSCLRSDIIARDVYEIAFTKPDGFTFRAGQFVLFDVPDLATPEDIQPRAYSIASAPSEQDLLFVIKLKDLADPLPDGTRSLGRASAWVRDALRPGVPVRMQGPFGVFTLPDPLPAHIVLVGTGTGIAPFRSHIHDLLSRGHSCTIDLLIGAHSAEDCFWIQDFTALAAAHPSLRIHPSLTRPSADWTGLQGRVQEHLPALLAGSDAHVYVCGNPDMVRDVKTLCMETLGMEKKNVHGEGYV